MRRFAIAALVCVVLVLTGGCAGGARPAAGPAPQIGGAAQVPDPDTAALLLAELNRVLAGRGITLDADGKPVGKAVSSVPQRVYTTPIFVTVVIPDELQASWPYDQTGDYDQNGEVNVADLTPIGVHYGKTSASPDWAVAQRADGDGNGEVNIADVTPIGVNFGAQVYGYVVEVQTYTGGPFTEFGFAPFASAQDLGGGKFFSYSGAGGSAVTDVRVAPVGPPRDFNWASVQVTDSPEDYQTAELCLLDGKPAVAFTSFRDSFGSRLGFAFASIPHPVALSNWTVEHAVALDYDGFQPPALAVINDEPVIAYFADTGGPVDLRYLRRDSGSGSWGSHIVTTFLGVGAGLDMAVREGKPVIFTDDMGLLTIFSTEAVPSSSFDWGSLPANPSLNTFKNIDAICSGPWMFAIGLTGPIGESVAFNRSDAPNPQFSSDYVEFAFGGTTNTGNYPSIVLNGGVPAFGLFDPSNAALVFMQAASRTDVNTANWQVQLVAGGESIHTETENPEICLIDGRPAIVAGYSPATFYWANSAGPASAADWHVQKLFTDSPHMTHSLVSIDGLPGLAFQTYSEAQSANQVAVATAQEKTD